VATAFGLLISCLTSTQIAAIFTTTILTLVIGINFSDLLVPFLSLSGAALWHCRRHPITVVCRPLCAACAALRSDAVIHRRERPLRNLSRRARHSPGDLYGHDGAVRWAGGPGSGYSQPVSGSATPLESMPDWLIEVMKITPTPHFVSFSQSVLYRAASLDIV
jgi:hypothetical protein